MWRRMYFAMLSSGLFMMTCACAMTGQTIELPEPHLNQSQQNGTLKFVLSRVRDLRMVKTHIGLQKNGLGVETGKVYPNQNVNVWLRKQIRARMLAAGFRIVREEDPNALRLEVDTLQFTSEPILYANSIDVEADISLRIRVISTDGSCVERQYYEKGKAPMPMPILLKYTSAVEHATANLVSRMIDDIAKLLRAKS